MLVQFFLTNDIGVTIYYLSDNKNFEGELFTVTSSDPSLLLDLLVVFPYLRERW